jgi:hypothetical protein
MNALIECKDRGSVCLIDCVLKNDQRMEDELEGKA